MFTSDWQIKTSKVKNSIKLNSLYALIQDTIAKKNNLVLGDYFIVNGRNAYGFNLPLPANPPIQLSNLCKDFIIQNAHLTIDEIYSSSQSKGFSGFSLAHYTEKYVKKGKLNNEEIIIHVYLNKLGEIISGTFDLSENPYAIQVKKNESRIDLTKDISLNLFKEFQVRCFSAIKKLKNLAMKRDEILLKAYYDSNETQEEIEENFRLLYLHKLDVNTKLQDLINKFKSQLEIINRYSDDIRDSRIDFINQLLTMPNIMTKKFPDTSRKQCELISEPIESQSLLVMDKKIDKQTLIVKYNSIINEKCVQLKKIDPNDNNIDTVIIYYNIIQDLKTLHLQKLFLLEKDYYADDRAKEIMDFLEKSPNMHSLFKDKCLAGNILEVARLFPYVNNLSIDDLIFIQQNLSESSALEENLIKVSRFLFENFTAFRALFLLDKTKYFLFCKSTNRKKKQVKEVQSSELMNSSSTMIKAWYNKKFKLLYEFLEYQVGNNEKFNFIGYASLIKYISVTAGSLGVLQEDFNLIIKRLIISDNFLKKIDKDVEVEKFNFTFNTGILEHSKIETLTNNRTILELICNQCYFNHLDLNTIKFFAEMSDIRSILLSLGNLINREYVELGFIRNNRNCFECISTAKDATIKQLVEEEKRNYHKRTKSDPQGITLIIHPKKEKIIYYIENTAAIEHFFELIKVLLEELNNKLSKQKLTMNLKEELYGNLSKKLMNVLIQDKSTQTEENKIEIFNLLINRLILLMQYISVKKSIFNETQLTEYLIELQRNLSGLEKQYTKYSDISLKENISSMQELLKQITSRNERPIKTFDKSPILIFSLCTHNPIKDFRYYKEKLTICSTFYSNMSLYNSRLARIYTTALLSSNLELVKECDTYLKEYYLSIDEYAVENKIHPRISKEQYKTFIDKVCNEASQGKYDTPQQILLENIVEKIQEFEKRIDTLESKLENIPEIIKAAVIEATLSSNTPQN